MKASMTEAIRVLTEEVEQAECSAATGEAAAKDSAWGSDLDRAAAGVVASGLRLDAASCRAAIALLTPEALPDLDALADAMVAALRADGSPTWKVSHAEMVVIAGRINETTESTSVRSAAKAYLAGVGAHAEASHQRTRGTP